MENKMTDKNFNKALKREINNIYKLGDKNFLKNKTILEIVFNTLLTDERIEEIRELIEDSQGVEIVEINNNGVLKD